jgi:hypothetical protein
VTRALLVIALAADFALGTWLVGWWAVPVLGVVHGLVLGREWAPARASTLAGALAWGGLLLAFGLSNPGVAPLAGRLAALLQLPTAGLYAATLLLPALLGGTSAALGGALRPR